MASLKTTFIYPDFMTLKSQHVRPKPVFLNLVKLRPPVAEDRWHITCDHLIRHMILRVGLLPMLCARNLS